MPLKIGTYTMTFMINQGEPPFPISTNATMNIATVAPSLTGTISVPALSISNASFEGTSADGTDGTTSFNFTANSTPVLEAYGMQIVCGSDRKLMGGMNIAATSQGPTATDPNEDACWLATHSVGGGGDEDSDDRGQERYGR
jgi:hypothetical protein